MAGNAPCLNCHLDPVKKAAWHAKADDLNDKLDAMIAAREAETRRRLADLEASGANLAVPRAEPSVTPVEFRTPRGRVPSARGARTRGAKNDAPGGFRRPSECVLDEKRASASIIMST